MPFTIVRQDITTMDVDVIVNAANVQLRAGGGVCGAIFATAGPADMEEACAALRPIQTGQAVITSGFELPAKFVIHTAGPIYDEHDAAEAEELLRASYRNSLVLAAEKGQLSIAFPLISAGIYGYPKGEALRAATEEITEFLQDTDMDVYLALLDANPADLGRDRVAELEVFIEEHLESDEDFGPVEVCGAPPSEDQAAPNMLRSAALGKDEDFLASMDVPFSTMLLRLIDAKGLTDVEVYKRANLDRRLFSKIRSGNGYMPSKKTIVALAIALELDLDETRDFLERAGFALSRAVLFDVIIEYFITRGNYNIYDINEVLFSYDQQLLGG